MPDNPALRETRPAPDFKKIEQQFADYARDPNQGKGPKPETRPEAQPPSPCRHQNLMRHDYGGELWWQCDQGCDFIYRAAAQREASVAPPQSAEKLAEKFHEIYERLAPSYGYETRTESAVPWESVPDKNKRLMIAVCSEILRGGL